MSETSFIYGQCILKYSHQVNFNLFSIYLNFMLKIQIFFHNSGSNQDIFILFEDLRSVLSRPL